MTTPEPMPGDPGPPYISVAAQRMYERLPRIYRILDERNGWALKRYLAGAVHFAGDIDTMIERIRGARPVGPAMPEPWDLEADELADWRAARRDVNSALTDPDLANPSWLSYIAQLLGAYLDPRSSLAERRDTIRFATSGYRGGTSAALADAARSALTGSRYVMVQKWTRGDGDVPSVWDITLRTRASETPVSSQEVIDTVIRKGAKPAGVRLWHTTYGTPWDLVEARFPTWEDWELRPWDAIEESGTTYEVPENMAPNPSFESDVSGWTPAAEGGGSVPDWALFAGGVDGLNGGRLTKLGATGGMRLHTTAAIVDATRVLPEREYIFAASARPSAAVDMALVIDWQNSSGAAISSTTVPVGTLNANEWNRTALTTRHLSPVGTARAVLNLVFTGTVPADTTVDVDAILFRLVTTTGG